MADETDPTEPQIINYVCFFSYPGRPGRYGAINAYNLDQAWDIAWASCAGTQWVPVRIFLQPVWTGNSVGPEGEGSVSEF